MKMSKKYKYRERWTHEGKRVEVKANSKAELRDKVAEKKRSLEEGRVIVESSMLVKDWVILCFGKFKKTAEITRKRDEQKANRWIVQQIGDMPLKRVKPLHLQEIMNQLDGYSSAFINDVYRLIKWVFGLAYDNKLINDNPSARLSKPKGKKNSRRSITEYERYHILKAIDEDESLRYFLPMLFCGLRPSEAQNIKGIDIDFKGSKLHVQGTKTERSDRYVPIPQYLLERLPHVADDEYVFTTVKGLMVDENGNRRLWNRLRRAVNLSMGAELFRNKVIPSEGQSELPFDESVTPYHLRHTFCCDCCLAGLPLTTTQYYMGHTSINLIAEVYYHMNTEAQNKGAELLEKRSQMVTAQYDNVIPFNSGKVQKYAQKGETDGETNAETIAITQ